MAFMSGELKYLYELLIEIGHPITASEAARLFAAGELAAYVQRIIDELLPPACAPGDTKCEGYDLYKCEEVLGSPQWVRTEINSTECGYVPPPPDPDIKEEGIRLYQARLDAWSIWRQLVQEFEYYRDAVSALTVEWFYAVSQWNKYRDMLRIWVDAEDEYRRNWWKAYWLQREADSLRAQVSNLELLISELYNEMFEIQDEIDWYEYIVEMSQEDISYWQNKYDQLGLDWYNCMVDAAWYGPACQDIYDEQMETREFLELAEARLEDALDNLTYYLQEKWLLMRKVDDAWNELLDRQAQLQDVENQIEDILGLLADIDTIMEQIAKFQTFVDSWNSEKWRLEEELEIAYIRVDMAARRARAAEDEWDNARRAWTAFKKEHPEIAQEILDEW